VIGGAATALLLLPSPVKIDISRETPGEETSETPPQVLTRNFNENTAAYLVEVEYPELQGLSNSSIQAKVNNEIRVKVFARVAAFHSQGSQFPIGSLPEGALGQSALAANYDTSFIGKNFFSALIAYSDYTAGAAHPTGYVEVFNYDLRTGTSVTLDQVLRELDPSPGTLQRLGQYVRQDLIRQLGDDPGSVELINDGAAPLPENYKNFNLSRSDLIVFFDPYQVAPFAAGTLKVEIPYAEFASSSDMWWLE
jgi:hypothetical protein